jgi:hypothetical protein
LGGATPPAAQSPTWRYLAEERCLPPSVLAVATDADAVREGPYGRAWFAPGVDGAVTHVEIRGPDYKGFTHRRH